MKKTIRIKRFNPEVEQSDYFSVYTIEVEGNTRVIDALEGIARNEDPSLDFRRSCIHGVCGSDAMRIDGKEKLACKTLFQDICDPNEDKVIEIEPLRNLEVKKDLVVDQTVFFDKYKSIKPYFMPKDEPPETEYLQSAEEHQLIDEASTCIGCGACYSACPVLQKNSNFIGPMALVQASRFINDSRDEGLAPRLDILDTNNGAWACENLFECTKVCPRGIKITKLINFTKRKIKKYHEEREEA